MYQAFSQKYNCLDCYKNVYLIFDKGNILCNTKKIQIYFFLRHQVAKEVIRVVEVCASLNNIMVLCSPGEWMHTDRSCREDPCDDKHNPKIPLLSFLLLLHIIWLQYTEMSALVIITSSNSYWSVIIMLLNYS